MGTRTRPARVRRTAGRRFHITLQEGKNRQIRRMVRKVGNHVVTLKRIRMASLRLGNLKEGQWRHLTAREVTGLLNNLPGDLSSEKT
jgi:23S rRNA pseudouridine2605 synthase/23S rRNA pseudouridine2604 synthase